MCKCGHVTVHAHMYACVCVCVHVAAQERVVQWNPSIPARHPWAVLITVLIKGVLFSGVVFCTLLYVVKTMCSVQMSSFQGCPYIITV